MNKVLTASFFCLVAATAVASAATVTADRVGHPGDSLSVATAGFGKKPVDIYFDATPVMRGAADGSHSIAVPADARPGRHWITALDRKSGDGARTMLDVNSDWPQLGFNARGGRNNSGENILTAKTVSGLALAWQSAINDMTSSPAVANGILYAGTRDGHLLALDAATGAQRWSAVTAAAIVSSPTVSDGTVYVTSNDHKLYAFDAATGAQRWASLTDYSISSSPVAANGLVYVVADSGTLFAFKARNGILAWQAAHDYLWPGSTPAAAGGLVYAMSSQNYVFAFDGASGKPIWAGGYMHAGNNAGSPAVSDGAVYMPTDGSLGAFDATSGQTLWQSGVGPGSASLALSKGSVFLATIDHVVWNFNAMTGALVSDTLEATAMESTPAAAHGVLYVGDMNGTISAYQAKTSKLLWSASTGLAAIVAAPTVANGRLYVVTTEGILQAYALSAGNDAAYKDDAAPPPFAKLH
ncbi:MAG TPA: PQQ-binding-like beta-propeller repeat protein [Rhizomicrobium sp.]|nr:PQQ-binding-like beta-propeller repeat protein [Rhizomicrobium sp.]